MNTVNMRQWVARTIELTRLYYPLQRHYGRKGGGFILAYHDPPLKLFLAQIEALEPNRPVPLDELVDRKLRHKSTAGLYAITSDDGVGETVRALSQACVENEWPITFYIPTDYLRHKYMPFQRLAILKQCLPSKLFQTSQGPVNLRDVRDRAEYFGRITRTMYTSQQSAYVPLIDELWQIASEVGSNTPRPSLPISREDMQQLSKSPLISFESHGVSHQAIAALPDDLIERELRDSRNMIQEHTGREVRHFCYPFGGMESIGRRAPKLVAKHYKSAVTMLRGRIAGQDPHLLPRIPFYDRDTPSIARLKILTT